MTRNQYSVLVLDLETTPCLLALQETRQLPRKTTNLEVECLSSRLPAQLETHYTVRYERKQIMK